MTFSGVISIPRPYDKEGAPSCGIYLVAPKKTSFNMMVAQLRVVFSALNGSRYQKNMHAIEFKFPKKIFEKERTQATTLVNMCRAAGVVAIIRDDVSLCVEADADGVILSETDNVEVARKVLGNRAIVGLDCGNSREKAELALSSGFDYVVFSKFFAPSDAKKHADISLLEWWSSATHLPAVAFSKLDVNRCIDLAKAGAGFIGSDDWVWKHENGPKQAIYLLQEAIEHGLGKIQMN